MRVDEFDEEDRCERRGNLGNAELGFGSGIPPGLGCCASDVGAVDGEDLLAKVGRGAVGASDGAGAGKSAAVLGAEETGETTVLVRLGCASRRAGFSNIKRAKEKKEKNSTDSIDFGLFIFIPLTMRKSQMTFLISALECLGFSSRAFRLRQHAYHHSHHPRHCRIAPRVLTVAVVVAQRQL